MLKLVYNPSLSAQKATSFSRRFFRFKRGIRQSVAFRATNLRMAVVCCRKYLSLSDNCL